MVEQLVVAGGLAEGEVGVGVDQPRHHRLAGRIDGRQVDAGGCGQRIGLGPDRPDAVTLEQDGGGRSRRCPRAIDEGATRDQRVGRHELLLASAVDRILPSVW